MLMLPKKYLITGKDPLKMDEFLNKLENHMLNGTNLVQLRAKELSKEKYIELAHGAIKLGIMHGVRVILNTDIETFKRIDSDGIHLTSEMLMRIPERPLPPNKLVSAACHNKEQLMKAKHLGIDFVTLSPVLPTKTHPDAHPLGWENFSALCKLVDIPVYAMGGMTNQDLPIALLRGAQGIAAISALWE